MEVKRGMLGVSLVLALAMPARVLAQSQAEQAIRFYAAGGAYCFRLAASGVVLAQETEWTVMVLTGASNRRNTFKIRDVDPGNTGLRGATLAAAGMLLNGVWRSDSDREEFFRRFAVGIDAGLVRARVVKAGPPNLDQLSSDRDRADVYLKFADAGSRISFEKVPDLTASEFGQYVEYFPD